jgi:hypothetical protein
MTNAYIIYTQNHISCRELFTSTYLQMMSHERRNSIAVVFGWKCDKWDGPFEY